MLVSTKRKNFGDRIASTREVLASLAQTKEAMPSDTLKLTGTSLELPLTKRAFERERVAGVMTLGKVKTVEDWTTRSQILPLQQQCWRHGRSSEAKCEWASKKSWFKIWSSPRSYKKYEEQLQRLSHAFFKGEEVHKRGSAPLMCARLCACDTIKLTGKSSLKGFSYQAVRGNPTVATANNRGDGKNAESKTKEKGGQSAAKLYRAGNSTTSEVHRLNGSGFLLSSFFA
jgi:hypothetical protein